MTSLFNSLERSYTWLMSKGDPRIADWPLMSTPFPILSIIAFYVYTVKVLGPRFMKHRQPFQIEPLIIVYNLLMVLASALFFHYGGQLTYIPPGGQYSLICQKVDYRLTPESMRLPHLGWWLMLLKMVEFADTLFFVLRKKFTHISMLHVVHHSLVPWGVWIGLKFGAGGHNAFFPLINLAVHTLMYSYYCLAALGPSVRKYLWWKRYLTIIQMIQFCMALIHACIPLVIDCGFQPFFAYAIIGHAIFFWIMFLNFYRKRYSDDHDRKDGGGDQKQRPLLASKTANGNALQGNGFKISKLLEEEPTAATKLTHRRMISIGSQNMDTSPVESSKNR